MKNNVVHHKIKTVPLSPQNNYIFLDKRSAKYAYQTALTAEYYHSQGNNCFYLVNTSTKNTGLF